VTHPPQSKGAGAPRHPSLLILAAALLLGGCTVGPEYSAEPRDDLAATADVQQSPPRKHHQAKGKHQRPHKGQSQQAAPSGTPSGGSGGSSSGNGTQTPDGGAGGAPAPAPAPGWTRATSVSDPTGDLGLTGGPVYADLTGVAVDDNGSRVRFTVTVAGRLPTSLPNGEVEGIGLDVFRSGRTESDYQLFLDCGDNWRAFLQTPKGFVAFPGTMTVGDRTLTVEVPWSSIGGRGSFGLGLFADWSREGGLVNDSSQDSAPNSGSMQVPVG